MTFKEMIDHLVKTREFSGNFAQRREIELCIDFANHVYDKLSV